MTDRQLLTLAAAMFGAFGDVQSPEEATAEALKLWYYAGGETGPRLPDEGPSDQSATPWRFSRRRGGWRSTAGSSPP